MYAWWTISEGARPEGVNRFGVCAQEMILAPQLAIGFPFRGSGVLFISSDTRRVPKICGVFAITPRILKSAQTAENEIQRTACIRKNVCTWRARGLFSSPTWNIIGSAADRQLIFRPRACTPCWIYIHTVWRISRGCLPLICCSRRVLFFALNIRCRTVMQSRTFLMRFWRF